MLLPDKPKRTRNLYTMERDFCFHPRQRSSLFVSLANNVGEESWVYCTGSDAPEVVYYHNNKDHLAHWKRRKLPWSWQEPGTLLDLRTGKSDGSVYTLAEDPWSWSQSLSDQSGLLLGNWNTMGFREVSPPSALFLPFLATFSALFLATKRIKSAPVHQQSHRHRWFYLVRSLYVE